MNDIKNTPVVTSRIRLARNIKKFPFPMMLSEEEGNEIIEEVVKVINNDKQFKDCFEVNILKEIDMLMQQEMMENHLISKNLLNGYEKGAVLLSKDKKISIMINEEDHIRIQCMEKGLGFNEAYEHADRIDDILENSLEYAFNEKMGFLTSCVTNVGTGLRASAMMHLPALKVMGELKKIIQTLSKIGLTVRGAYGEGSEALGDMFQISNQVTLGVSEKEIIEAVKNIILQLIEKEEKGRKFLIDNDRLLIEDKIYRSYGILKNAKLLNYEESMMLLSDVILGVDLGIIEGNNSILHHIMNSIQPASLQLIYKEKLSERERDIKRAEYIGKLLN